MEQIQIIRKKTLSCELRHLLERCNALTMDIVTENMMYLYIKTMVYDHKDLNEKNTTFKKKHISTEFLSPKLLPEKA